MRIYEQRIYLSITDFHLPQQGFDGYVATWRNHACRTRQYAGGRKVSKDNSLSFRIYDGVPRVWPSHANSDVGLALPCQKVRHFAFAFRTELPSYNNADRHIASY